MQFQKNANHPSGKDNLEVFPEGQFLWNSLQLGSIALIDRGVQETSVHELRGCRGRFNFMFKV